jgi:hypothetical protein
MDNEPYYRRVVDLDVLKGIPHLQGHRFPQNACELDNVEGAKCESF